MLPGIRQRIQRVVGAFWSMSDPTTTHRRQVEIVREQFGPANLRGFLAPRVHSGNHVRQPPDGKMDFIRC